MYLFAHSFCASGIWAQPDMVLCVRVSHKASIKVSSWLRSHLKAQLGKVCFQAHCDGCWLEASFSRHIDICTGHRA